MVVITVAHQLTCGACGIGSLCTMADVRVQLGSFHYVRHADDKGNGCRSTADRDFGLIYLPWHNVRWPQAAGQGVLLL